MLIRTDDTECCLEQIYIAMCIGNYVRGSFHDQYEVVCGLEKIIHDDALT
jgi:hypothetical protein